MHYGFYCCDFILHIVYLQCDLSHYDGYKSTFLNVHFIFLYINIYTYIPTDIKISLSYDVFK